MSLFLSLMSRPRAFAPAATVTAMVALSACFSSPPPPVTADRPVRQARPALDAQTLAAINADLRMVGTDSTWVARGTAFELVARSKADIPDLQRPLEDVARSFRRVFNVDPAPVIVAVRHPTIDGRGPQGAAPLPDGTAGDIVEVLLSDDQEQPVAGSVDSRSGGRGTNGARGPAVSGRYDLGRGTVVAGTAKVTRAWLATHETAVSGKPQPAGVRNGESDDPNIAAWIESGIPGLLAGMPREDQLTAQLAAHSDRLYPLRTLLTMTTRPATVRPAQVAQAGGGQGRGGSGGGGGGGGMGGRGGGMGGGGMGGRSGGGGRGGMGGGRGGGSGGQRDGDAVRALPALHGGALFDAQSALFMRFLVAREGYPFVGTVVDAIMQGKTVSDAFESAKLLPPDLDRIEDDWRRWITARGTRAGS